MNATFTFIDELNDFLPRHLKNTSFNLEFAPHQSLKHLIESLGVPHTDYGRLLINGLATDDTHRLHEADQITIFPADDPLTGEARFILDNHLGQLATYLRMMGFDSLYRNDFQDEELALETYAQGRVLLTRDRRLLMRKAIRLGYCIHSSDPRQQIVEVIRRFRLQGRVKPFQCCLRCNGSLQVVEKQAVLDRLEPLTKLYYDDFRICPECQQIYWKGSHYGRMLKMIEAMASQA